MMDTVVSILLATLVGSLKMTALVFGPVFLAAFLMFLVSRFINRVAQGSIGYKAYVWITAPGTIVHELGHAIFCLIFLHKIKEISLFNPEPDGTLGYVRHAWDPTSLYQKVGNFYIATGPIWFACVVVYLLSLLLVDAGLFAPLLHLPVGVSDLASPGAVAGLLGRFTQNLWSPVAGLFTVEHFHSWTFWVFMYLTTCIGLHMSLSPADMQGGLPGLLLLIIGILLFNAVVAILVAVAPSVAAASFYSGLLALLTSVSLIVSGGVLLIMTPALALMLVIGVPSYLINRGRGA